MRWINYDTGGPAESVKSNGTLASTGRRAKSAEAHFGEKPTFRIRSLGPFFPRPIKKCLGATELSLLATCLPSSHVAPRQIP